MYSRGTSTKTRIETYDINSLYPSVMDSRGTSTKTRIETWLYNYNIPKVFTIQEAHPLKQGLKQYKPSLINP